MNKTKQKIEAVFKKAHLAASKLQEPVFSTKWQSRVMDEVVRSARPAPVLRNDDVPLNAFAFRLGWAMLGLAFVVSVVFCVVGINTLHKTESGSKSSLWEFVDQSVNTYDVNLFDKTSKAKGSDVK